MNRVVITGMGVVSPIGNTINEFWKNLSNGVSGIDACTNEVFKMLPVGEVKDNFSDVDGVFSSLNKNMNRATEFAIVAASEALSNARIDLKDIDVFETAVVLGSNPSLSEYEQVHKKLYEKKYKHEGMKEQLNECNFDSYICGYHPAAYLSALLGIRRLAKTITNACAAGAYAVASGYEMIRSGEVKMAIVGGAEASLNANAFSLFSILGVMSKEKNYKEACRPFSKNRSGCVLGEGAGILILESMESAIGRGVPILGEIVGYSAHTDLYHITSPDVTGKACSCSIEKAIENASITKDDIDYINAHGTGTYYNDLIETLGIKRVFGERAYKIPISSNKSMMGHLLTASGAVEVIATICAIKSAIIPPTINLDEDDENCDLDYVKEGKREVDITYALSNSFGFGGQNVCVVMKKWSEKNEK